MATPLPADPHPSQPLARRRSAGRWALWAAVAGVVGGVGMMTPSDALAQYRIDDGRALDSNRRVGSEGRNDLAPDYRRDIRATPNQIVTGNASGLFNFRDRVNYREAAEFRGNVASENSDLFIRRTTGGYQGVGVGPTAVYSRSRTVAPPSNYVGQGYGTGAYVPNPIAASPDRQITTGGGTSSLDFSTGTFTRRSLLPPPNTMLLQQPTVTPDGQQGMISASPLTGVRRVGPGGTAVADPLTGLRLDDNTIRQMRAEIGGLPGGAQPGQPGQPEPLDLRIGAGQAADPQARPGQAGQPIGQPLGSPIDPNANRQQQTRYRLTVPPPEQQSKQYAEMRRRLEQYNADRGATDEQAFRAFQKAREAQQQQGGAAPARPQQGQQQPAQPQQPQQPQPGQGQPQQPQQPPQPGQPAPAVVPPQTPAERAGLPDYAARSKEILAGKDREGEAKEGGAARRPAPVKVDSLATGVSGQGLTNFLKQAEGLMKEGKYAAALDQYEAAAQVAPNNPMIDLGRANAQLGAGFYAPAETHLRNAFTNDPALLVAQYNLTNFLGEERLQQVVADLKDIANREQKEARPVFLLAYLAYNTGNERMAAGYLDLADKRSGGKDPLYDTIRQHWNLPAGEPADPAEQPAEPAKPDQPAPVQPEAAPNK